MATDLIFDFFGTLVHYTPGPFHTAPYSRTHDFICRQGFALAYEDFTRTYAAVSRELEERAAETGQEYSMEELSRQFFQTTFDRDVPEDLIGSFVAVYLEEWSRGIAPIASLPTFLERLARDYRLSVLSNTNYAPLIHANLAALGVSQHFSRVFTSIEIGIRKPHPAIFHHALEQLRITPGDAVYIGDSYDADYRGATGAGLRCILIDPEEQYGDVPHRVDTLFGLEAHLSFS